MCPNPSLLWGVLRGWASGLRLEMRVHHPSVFVGDWFQDPHRYQNPTDAQVVYIKWCSTVGPSHWRILHSRLAESAEAEPMDTEVRVYFM